MNLKTVAAYSEAAHAFLFLHKKRPFLKVVLGSFPRVTEGKDIIIDSYDSAIVTLEIATAGIIAEGMKEEREISINELVKKVNLEGRSEDIPIEEPIHIGEEMFEGTKALIYICGGSQNFKEETRLLLTWIHFRIKNLLLNRWKIIETIASALLEKGELNFDDPVFKQIAER